MLVKADPFSALSSSLSEFYRPRMRKETEEKFWNAIDSLFQEIPFYHLNCRPDKEATEIVKKYGIKEGESRMSIDWMHTVTHFFYSSLLAIFFDL